MDDMSQTQVHDCEAECGGLFEVPGNVLREMSEQAQLGRRYAARLRELSGLCTW
jgi:hypothetical protein